MTVSYAPPLRLGDTLVRISPALVETVLPDGRTVYGAPHDTRSYRERARESGYGDDIERMNRCHEIAHSLLAVWLGLPCSPVLAAVASGEVLDSELFGMEENVVLALEQFANAVGVDLERVGEGFSRA